MPVDYMHHRHRIGIFVPSHKLSASGKTRGIQPCPTKTMTVIVILAAMLPFVVVASTMATTQAWSSRNASLNFQSRCATTIQPYVPCPLLGNKGAHINNGNIVPDSTSTTQEETIPDIQNTSISQASGDFGCFEKRGLHFVHLNARSILPKMGELDILAHNTNAAIIAVTESWLDNTIHDNEVCIPGYSIQRKDRNREGGGVCMFIRNNINFNRRSDIDNDDFEFLAIDIMLPKSKPILLGVGYRPPRDNRLYAKLEDVLSSCTNFFKQECYILGDFNTDVLAEKNVLKNDFENFMRIFDLKQIITEPTRITDTSETAIDLICTSDVVRCSSL